MLPDKIPAKLDDKLEEGVEVMDRIRHPLSKHLVVLYRDIADYMVCVGGTVGAIVDKILRRDFPPTRAELFERDFIEG
jgi:hypothetical protein